MKRRENAYTVPGGNMNPAQHHRHNNPHPTPQDDYDTQDQDELELTGDANEEVEETTSRIDLDSVRQYLAEIGRVPLLNHEEEMDLGRRIEAGQAAAEILEKRADLSDREQRHYQRVIEDGQAAREHLINANLRLVVSIAKKQSPAACTSSTSSRKATAASCTPPTSTTTPKASSSAPTPPGGSANPSTAP